MRPAVKEQVESLGGKFIEVEAEEGGEDAGGYAKEMSEEYKQKQQQLIFDTIIKQDMVITVPEEVFLEGLLLKSWSLIGLDRDQHARQARDSYYTEANRIPAGKLEGNLPVLNAQGRRLKIELQLRKCSKILGKGTMEEGEVRGYIGAILGAGIGVNGQIDTPGRAYVDTSVLFALRGGLLMGKDSRWILGFEVAPVSNRLDWRLRATATGFLQFGSLVPLKRHRNMAWLWKVGIGAGGGLDYRFLVAAQVDILTFNYKMNDRLWVDFGIPTVRFHIEAADQARWNTQIVFPLGITFAI